MFCVGAVGELCDIYWRDGFIVAGDLVWGLGGVGVFFVMPVGFLAGHRKNSVGDMVCSSFKWLFLVNSA